MVSRIFRQNLLMHQNTTVTLYLVIVGITLDKTFKISKHAFMSLIIIFKKDIEKSFFIIKINTTLH